MSLMCALPGKHKRRNRRRSVDQIPSNKSQKKQPRHSCSSNDSGILLERSRNTSERQLRRLSSLSTYSALRKLVVLQGFRAATRDELDVTRGEVLNVLEQTDDCDWVLVENVREQQGYVPISYCVPLVMWETLDEDESNSDSEDDGHITVPSPSPSSHLTARRPLPTIRHSLSDRRALVGGRISVASIDACYTCELAVDVNKQACEFFKKPEGVAVARYAFTPCCEDDVGLTPGEWLLLLNTHDPDWAWVRKKNDSEGFVPKAYISVLGNWTETKGRRMRRHHTDSTTTPMLVEWSYEALHESTVSIKRGEVVYADVYSKTSNGWLWIHVPRTGEDGFIPATFVRPLITNV